MIFLVNIQHVTFDFPILNKQTTIKVSNVTYEVNLIFEHTHRALSGRLFSFPQGFRFNATVSYDASLEPEAIRTLADDFQQEFEDEKGDFVRMYPGYGSGDYIDIVPQSFDYVSEYNNTVGLFRPYFVLQAYRLFDTIQALRQAFVIDEQDSFVTDSTDQKVIIQI